jgi:hypothetical protein
MVSDFVCQRVSCSIPCVIETKKNTGETTVLAQGVKCGIWIPDLKVKESIATPHKWKNTVPHTTSIID